MIYYQDGDFHIVEISHYFERIWREFWYSLQQLALQKGLDVNVGQFNLSIGSSETFGMLYVEHSNRSIFTSMTTMII